MHYVSIWMRINKSKDWGTTGTPSEMITMHITTQQTDI